MNLRTETNNDFTVYTRAVSLGSIICRRPALRLYVVPAWRACQHGAAQSQVAL